MNILLHTFPRPLVIKLDDHRLEGYSTIRRKFQNVHFLKKKKLRRPKSIEVEKLLLDWLNNRAGKVPVSDEILLNKAKDFGEHLQIHELKFSYGWLQGFKSRHGIRLRKLHGEQNSSNFTLMHESFPFIVEQLEEFKIEDIYNLDETALFFRLEPDRTLASNIIKGTKKSKERVTLVLCCNATGTDKLKPLVIGKTNKPRCFKDFNFREICEYKSNDNGWMTRSLFVDFLIQFDQEITKQNRHVALILDNCPSHKVQLFLY